MDGVPRIIDANLNRAREAMRVMEEVARLALDDQDLCGALKSLRHELRDAAENLPFDRSLLLAHRDTPGDVGAALTTPGEMRRESLTDVAIAGAARLTESLRTLEEVTKTLHAGYARSFEAMRYRAYTLEKRLVLGLGIGRCPQWRLCVLVTSALCTHHSWERVVELAIEGGADCVQLREKELADGAMLRMARRLTEVAHSHAVHAIINDRAALALLGGADGVHLGRDDLPVGEARALAGRRLLIGASTADLNQARRAVHDGVDYCGVGPMFPTTTKHKPDISGPEYLRAYLSDPATAQRPHLAIGGITPDNVGVLVEAGCRGVAVSSSVCGASDPRAVCRDLRAALDGAPSPTP